MKERARDRLKVLAVAFGSRAAVIAWGASRFPAAADGTYYDRIAARIASGNGYTWVWPDGAVTFAAHYPIGYPALIASLYALFGAHAFLAMLVNAIFGSLASVAAYDLARASGWGKRAALFSGLGVAIHPALVPYTLAVMTEGVTASLLVIAAAFAARYKIQPKTSWIVMLGISLGIATLVRPQSICSRRFSDGSHRAEIFFRAPASRSSRRSLRSRVVFRGPRAIACACIGAHW